MGLLKLKFWKKHLQTMGLRGWRLGKRIKLFTFLSLRLQKCIMIIFLEKLFGFMDILHINK
jgi:hypothetical protein